MRPYKHATSLGLVALLVATLGAPGCFVSIDESLIAASEAGDSGVPDDSSVDGGVEADSSTNDETGTDAVADSSNENFPDSGDSGQPDALDATVPDGDSGPVDGAVDGDPFDGPVRVCYGDAWCPPIGCKLQKCQNGVCVDDGDMTQTLPTYQLDAPPIVRQSAFKKAVVAVHGYLVILTAQGLVVLNTRNPNHVFEEKTFTLKGVYRYLVRSGNRVWLFSNSAEDQMQLAWLDLPLDGVGLVPEPTETIVRVSRFDTGLGAPNGAMFLFGYHSSSSEFARYRPGLPTSLHSYVAQGAEPGSYAIASTGNRVLLHRTFSPSSGYYQHRFSLQNNPTSSLSENTEFMTEGSLKSHSSNLGYIASSQKGAIVWIVGNEIVSGAWNQLRVYWLTDGANQGLNDGVYKVFEDYSSQPISFVPVGPVAFVDDETVATIAKTNGGQQKIEVIARKTAVPELVARIPANGLFDITEKSMAGDDGYAYLVTNSVVHIYRHACQP